MNKHLEVENPQNRYYQKIFQLPNPLLLGEIIMDKGRIVLDMEKESSSLKLRGGKILLREGNIGFCQHGPINQEDPFLGKLSNSNCSYSPLSLSIFLLT